MEIKIGKIEDKDVRKTKQFCLSIFDEMKWNKRFAYGLENLKKSFSKPREIFLIAKDGEEIIGCAGLKELSKIEALMKRLYIAKRFRGKGLASLMFEIIKEFAREKNYKRIVLDVHHNNLRAKKFYQKCGFLEFSPIPNEHWLESKHPEIYEFRKLDLKT